MDQEAAFIQAIQEELHDESLKLIFADWLEEQDDPRGQWIRNPCVRMFMGDKFEHPLPQMIASLEKCKNILAIRYACVEIGDEVVPDLLPLLWHKKAKVRRYTALCFWKMGESAKAATAGLLSALKDEDNEVRVNAAKALLAIGPPPEMDLQPLRDALTDPNYKVSEYARKILAKLESKEKIVEVLSEKLESGDEETQEEAAWSLAHMEGAGVETLCKGLSHQSRRIREHAARLLGETTTPKMKNAVEPLREVLKKRGGSDEFWENVLGAVVGLEQTGAPLAEEVLKHAKKRTGTVELPPSTPSARCAWKLRQFRPF